MHRVENAPSRSQTDGAVRGGDRLLDPGPKVSAQGAGRGNGHDYITLRLSDRPVQAVVWRDQDPGMF